MLEVQVHLSWTVRHWNWSCAISHTSCLGTIWTSSCNPPPTSFHSSYCLLDGPMDDRCSFYSSSSGPSTSSKTDSHLYPPPIFQIFRLPQQKKWLVHRFQLHHTQSTPYLTFSQFHRCKTYGDVISSQRGQVEFQSNFWFIPPEYLLPQSLHWTCFWPQNLTATSSFPPPA